LCQLLPAALGGSLFAPSLHAGAFIKGVLPESPQRPIPRDLFL
jgi:hypothetical protein